MVMPAELLAAPLVPYWVVKVALPVLSKPWMNSSEEPCGIWLPTEPVVAPLR